MLFQKAKVCNMNRAGTYIKNLSGEMAYRSFRPSNLPPQPDLEIDEEMLRLLVKAHRQLAQLDTLSGSGKQRGGRCRYFRWAACGAARTQSWPAAPFQQEPRYRERAVLLS